MKSQSAPPNPATVLFRWLILGLTIITTATLLFSRDTGNNKQKADITWSAPAIAIDLLAGSHGTINLSFSSSANLRDVSLQFSPELNGLMSATPTYYKKVKKGEQYPVLLMAEIPGDMLPMYVSGVLALHTSKQHKPEGDVIPPAISISITSKWPSVESSYITFTYPPLLHEMGINVEGPFVEERENGFVQVQISLSTPSMGSVETFRMILDPNETNLSLDNWFHKFIDPEMSLASSGAFARSTFENGTEAWVLAGEIPDAYDLGPVAYAYVKSPTKPRVAIVSLSHDHELDQMGFSTSADRNNLLTAIVSQLEVNQE